jgi:hypothetical protein
MTVFRCKYGLDLGQVLHEVGGGIHNSSAQDARGVDMHELQS